MSAPPQQLLDHVLDKFLLSTLGDRDAVAGYLAQIARATAGCFDDKTWLVMAGERNSGKGLLQELNARAWGPYVNTVHANSFILTGPSSMATDAAKSMSWALDCEHARQTYTNEVKCDFARNVRLDGNIIKALQSGGDPLVARRNFQDERTFRIASRLIMNINDMPRVSPDDALATMLLFKFPFAFKPPEEITADSPPFYRPRDETIKQDLVNRPEIADAFCWLVFDAFADVMPRPCERVRADTAAYLAEWGDALGRLSAAFRVTGRRDDFVTSRSLKDWDDRKAANVSEAALKDRLIRMGARADANCFVARVRHGRGLLGVKWVAGDPTLAVLDDDLEP